MGWVPPEWYRNPISDSFAYLLLDIPAHPDDGTGEAILVFYPHVDQAAAVGHPVEGGQNPAPAPAELLSDRTGKTDESAMMIGDRLDHGLKSVGFVVHKTPRFRYRGLQIQPETIIARF